MYYKLTMKDKRVVFVPVREVNSELLLTQPIQSNGLYLARDSKGRLKQLKTIYPDCVDWEMVEWEDVDTHKALEVAAREGWCSPE